MFPSSSMSTNWNFLRKAIISFILGSFIPVYCVNSLSVWGFPFLSASRILSRACLSMKADGSRTDFDYASLVQGGLEFSILDIQHDHHACLTFVAHLPVFDESF